MFDLIPMIGVPLTERDAIELSPLTLAFVGDAVQTLYERTAAATGRKTKPWDLHQSVSKDVNAGAQAQALKRIIDRLTEQEVAVYKRARNSKSSSSAKNASVVDYRVATGYEAVVGYLYLTGKTDRLNVLLKDAYEIVADIKIDTTQNNTETKIESKTETLGEIKP